MHWWEKLQNNDPIIVLSMRDDGIFRVKIKDKTYEYKNVPKNVMYKVRDLVSKKNWKAAFNILNTLTVSDLDPKQLELF